MPPVLSQVPLFSGLPPDACDRLEAQMSRRDYPPQTVIVREGGAGDAAFVILNGLVAVRRRDKDSGLEFTLTELKPGEMFGEMALLTGKPRTATVVALQPTTCAVLERASFEQVLRSHPMLAMFLTAVMAERLERANQRTGVDFINLARMKVDPRVLTLLPTALVNQHHIVPVSFCNNRLTLAMTNPNNVVAFDDVRRVIKGVMIEPVAVSDEDFRRFMSTTYVEAMKTSPSAPGTAPPKASRAPVRIEPQPEKSAATVTVDLLQADRIRELQLADEQQVIKAETKQDLMNASEDAPIIRIANSILGLAIKQGASDIHIEPMEEDVTVRFRIDGVLQVLQKLPKKVQLGLVSRVKILS